MRFVYSLLCVLALALTAPAHADTPSPNQVVQMLVDDLGKTMEARRAELSKDREGLLKVIDGSGSPNAVACIRRSCRVANRRRDPGDL